jgi:hypothetical protein
MRFALIPDVEDFFDSFARDSNGVWTCLVAATIEHPKGRIQVTPGSRFSPGTNFMGVDLAAWLDEQRPVPGGNRANAPLDRSS